MFICTGLKLPAFRLAVPAPKPGAKGRPASVFAQAPPPGAVLSVNPADGVAGAFPDHGVITEVVAFGPQLPGLVSTAVGPSSKSRLKELNGTCGRPSNCVSSKVVVSCPVCGSALTLPIRRAEMPYRADSTSTKIRYSFPEAGSRLSCCPT